MATLTYVYSDSTAVLGPLATYAEPHCYDLCAQHAERLTAPRGWEIVRLAGQLEAPAPSPTTCSRSPTPSGRRPGPGPGGRDAGAGQGPPGAAAAVEIGRRGHLRVLRDPECPRPGRPPESSRKGPTRPGVLIAANRRMVQARRP